MLLLGSAALFSVTCIAVLVKSVNSGTIPRDLVPVPLCWAGSDGPPKTIFSTGLMISGLLLAFAMPTLCYAYASLLDSPVELFGRGAIHNGRAESWLVLFARLAISGLFLLAAVPLNKETADHLRKKKKLNFTKSQRDAVHGFGACMFFSFAACFCAIVIAILTLADRADLQVRCMLWSKLFAPVAGVAMTFSLRMMQSRPGGEHSSPVTEAGCAQCGLLCAMVAFLLLTSLDLTMICASDLTGCSSTNSEHSAVDWFSWILTVFMLLYALHLVLPKPRGVQNLLAAHAEHKSPLLSCA